MGEKGFDRLSPNGHAKTLDDRHPSQVNTVMIGVGAAFDFQAGTVQRAPAWCVTTGWNGCIVC